MNDFKLLKEDFEFRSLMPPISSKDYTFLEQGLLRGDIAETIYTWNNIILIGYGTYEILKNHNLPCIIKQMQFETRNDAMCWICDYYLQLDDLSDVMKKYLIGKLFVINKELNGIKAHEFSHGKTPGYIYQTAITIGNKYNMAQNTVYKYGIYASSIDCLFAKVPTLPQRILSCTLKISYDNVIELARLSYDQLKILDQNLSDDHIEHIGYSDMRHELQWRRLPSPQPKSDPLPQDNIPIKQLPKYDPDSEISSLTLTIPSWISSIDRTRTNANFQFISQPAKDKLMQQILEMELSLENILNAIKEDYNG